MLTSRAPAINATETTPVAVDFECTLCAGVPVVAEPKKCAEWRWCAPREAPEPRFVALEHLIASRYLCDVVREARDEGRTALKGILLPCLLLVLATTRCRS